MRKIFMVIKQFCIKKIAIFTRVSMAIIKTSTNIKCSRGCGEKESIYPVDGKVNWYSHFGKTV